MLDDSYRRGNTKGGEYISTRGSTCWLSQTAVAGGSNRESLAIRAGQLTRAGAPAARARGSRSLLSSKVAPVFHVDTFYEVC